MTLTVTAAAIKIEAQVYHLPRPARHHHVIHFLVEIGHKPPIRGEQGFLLSDGTFVGRITAAKVAVEAGQIKKSDLVAPPWLFSEDVW